MAWLKIKNDWIRRLIRGAALGVVLLVINMILPISYLMQGPIGTSVYYVVTFIISGFVMWHVISKIPGKA